MRYFIEISVDNKGGKVAAELITDGKLTKLELEEAVIEFAKAEGIYLSLALTNTMYKIEA